jgi:exonuclease SbcC
LSETGFPDAAAARVAFQPTDVQARWQKQIEAYQGEVAGLIARIEELRNVLGHRRVSVADVQTAEDELQRLAQELRSGRHEHATMTEQSRQLEEKIKTAEKYRRQLNDERRQHQVFARLAEDLRSDNFQAFLLQETFGKLVRGASHRLMQLSGERFGLDFREDEIVVIDQDNAGARRSTDTLSGGETFLTALSLALELSEQVQHAVGAVQMDCLFIDEGFGTLDPEALNQVADAIHNLQVGGRMVGIITHIPELMEQFDQRVLVEKVGGVSRLRVESGADLPILQKSDS